MIANMPLDSLFTDILKQNLWVGLLVLFLWRAWPIAAALITSGFSRIVLAIETIGEKVDSAASQTVGGLAVARADLTDCRKDFLETLRLERESKHAMANHIQSLSLQIAMLHADLKLIYDERIRSLEQSAKQQ